MPFVCEDVGTTKRRRMTPTRALKAWENTGGVCVVCSLKIDGTKEAWFVEHPRALELGGADDDVNIGPAHYERCKAIKDADDHSRAGKAKRNKRAELGIRQPSRLSGPRFVKPPPQRRASSPLSKPLPPRRLAP
jgi:5-methylcytosine-specific restriction protein A